MGNLTALVTGSSSGIGLAVAELLLEREPELQIVGLSRRPGPLESHERFTHWPTDLTSQEATRKRATRFLQEHQQCPILVHAAGAPLFSPSNEWKPEQLEALVNLNLTTPMTLTGALTQRLRQSKALVVFVGSTSSRERAPLGAAYGATKAGLAHFAENYFQENRKHGIRVLHLCPGMTGETEFYQSERFEPAEGEEMKIRPTDLAETIYFFMAGPGKMMNPTSLVLEPQKVGVRKKSTPPQNL